MKGIQFVVNDTGEKKAVLIDLERWGYLWEDLLDIIISQNRKDEDNVDWSNFKLKNNENINSEQMKVLELFGTIDYDEDYNYKKQRQIQ